jgi:hypothetical protein
MPVLLRVRLLLHAVLLLLLSMLDTAALAVE